MKSAGLTAGLKGQLNGLNGNSVANNGFYATTLEEFLPAAEQGFLLELTLRTVIILLPYLLVKRAISCNRPVWFKSRTITNRALYQEEQRR